MKKTPKKFYVKKPVKVRKNKSGEARSRFVRPHLTWPRLKFPSILRLIPERFNRILSHIDRFTLISFASGVLVMLVGIALFDFQLDTERLTIAKQNKEKLLKERDYWQRIVGEHQGYRDGYYMLAVSEYRLGNTEQAQTYVQKVLELDPFFEEGRVFEHVLKGEKK